MQKDFARIETQIQNSKHKCAGGTVSLEYRGRRRLWFKLVDQGLSLLSVIEK